MILLDVSAPADAPSIPPGPVGAAARRSGPDPSGFGTVLGQFMASLGVHDPPASDVAGSEWALGPREIAVEVPPEDAPEPWPDSESRLVFNLGAQPATVLTMPVTTVGHGVSGDSDVPGERLPPALDDMIDVRPPPAMLTEGESVAPAPTLPPVIGDISSPVSAAAAAPVPDAEVAAAEASKSAEPLPLAPRSDAPRELVGRAPDAPRDDGGRPPGAAVAAPPMDGTPDRAVSSPLGPSRVAPEPSLGGRSTTQVTPAVAAAAVTQAVNEVPVRRPPAPTIEAGTGDSRATAMAELSIQRAYSAGAGTAGDDAGGHRGASSERESVRGPDKARGIQSVWAAGEARQQLPATPSAAPATPVAAPPDTAEAELPHRIVQSIRMQALAGGGEAVLRLRPEYLGELVVAVKVERGAVTAVMQSDTPSVRQWIESHEASLRQALAEHGLQLDRLSVSGQSSRADAGDGEDGSHSHEPDDHQPPPHSRRPRPPAPDATFEIVI